MKKALLMVLSLVLVVALTIGGTLAYLTDRDSKTNVFTVGDVRIELNEDFDQGATLIPGKEIEKDVSITNIGKNDAYVWVEIAVPAALDNGGAVIFKEVTAGSLWNWIAPSKATVIDGGNYNVHTVKYTTALLPDKTTESVMSTVSMDPKVDIDPNGDWYLVENGVATDLNWNSSNGNPVIYVSAYAIQSEGFATIDEAINAYNTQWGTNGGEYAPAPVVVSSANEMIEALENGKGVVLTDDVKIDPAGMSSGYGTTGINVKNGQTIDGNGNILDIKGAGGTWDSGINTTGGLIKDLTVTGSFRGIFINHNSSHSEPVILENVIIDGTTYTISCDQGMNQGLEATNCTFNGWTSYAATLGNAKFVNCSFGEGNGYSFMRPYAPTEFVGCEFEAGYTVDPRAAVTFENCTLDGVAITTANIGNLVTDTANVTVK